MEIPIKLNNPFNYIICEICKQQCPDFLGRSYEGKWYCSPRCIKILFTWQSHPFSVSFMAQLYKMLGYRCKGYKNAMKMLMDETYKINNKIKEQINEIEIEEEEKEINHIEKKNIMEKKIIDYVEGLDNKGSEVLEMIHKIDTDRKIKIYLDERDRLDSLRKEDKLSLYKEIERLKKEIITGETIKQLVEILSLYL
jgi:hypothetical protein